MHSRSLSRPPLELATTPERDENTDLVIRSGIVLPRAGGDQVDQLGRAAHHPGGRHTTQLLLDLRRGQGKAFGLGLVDVGVDLDAVPDLAVDLHDERYGPAADQLWIGLRPGLAVHLPPTPALPHP